MTTLSDHHVQELVQLARRRYEGWDNFDHPLFAAEELAYKRTAVAHAADLLNQTECDRLLAANDHDTFLERLDRLCRDTNLLWRRVPSAGDTAVLHHPALDKATFCTHVRNLLHADRPSPERLQSFSDYLTAHDLPNKWPLPTYLLFLCHPQTELFVRPQAAAWFLKFVGQPLPVSGAPDGATYQTIQKHAQTLLEALRPFHAQDMVDVQSLLWVGFRESQETVGKLDPKAQIALDIPPTEPLIEAYAVPILTQTLHEPASSPDYATTRLPDYSLTALAADTGYAAAELARWVRAVERKGQAVFYGPPGTGKTFVAQKLAAHLAGGGDGVIELVQFHPAYAYEDFMQGIRPFTTPTGALTYDMVDGRFRQFCRQAQQRQGTSVFIIDEINRANVAAVFGELMYLLEYRDQDIPLAGGGRFRIPANVRLLGTMNTADRSIALVDHALRRRFAFIPLRPNYDILRRAHPDFDTQPLIATLQRLNQQIGDPHYHIGVTYFLLPDLPAHLPDIWRMEIEPYLEEFFFDRPDVLETFRWEAVKQWIVGSK